MEHSRRSRTTRIAQTRVLCTAVLCATTAIWTSSARATEFVIVAESTGVRATAAVPCWDAAPPDAKVGCARETKEHEGSAQARLVAVGGPVSERVIGTYETFDITATAPSDYVADTGELVIEPGNATSEVLDVTIVDDDVVEDIETFGVRVTDLQAPDGYSLQIDHVVFPIADNDSESTAIELSADPDEVGEGDGAKPVEVTATLDGTVLADATTVTVSVSGSGDEAAVDFEPVSDFTITIAAGERSGTGTFTLTPVADEVWEYEEKLDVAGTASNSLAVDPTTVHLLDDDPLRAEVSDETGEEDSGQLVFTVTVGEAAVDVEVTYGTQYLTARFHEDYRPTSGTVTFEAGVTSHAVTVELIDDLLHEDTEQFSLALGAIRIDYGRARSSDAKGTGTILDNDAPPAVGVVGESADEGRPVHFQVTLDAPSGLPSSVGFATSDGTAKSAGRERDYRSHAGTVHFAPGEVAKTVRVATLDDELVEGNETLTLSLRTPMGATLSTNSEAVGTIVDNDAATLRIADASAREDAERMAFRVTLTPAAATAVEVDYATEDRTARENADYRPSSGTLTFMAGETVATVWVELVDDAIEESTERFVVRLTDSAGANIGDEKATGTIRDNDTVPRLAVANVGVDESASTMDFVVTLDVGDDPVGVTFSTVDGTATAGADYQSATGRLDFPAGTALRTVSVVVLDDEIDEFDETLSLELSDAQNALPPDFPATGTILDDDLPAVSVKAVPATVTEGTPVSFDIVVEGIAPPSGGVTLRLDQQGDYLAAAPGELQIPFGVTPTARYTTSTVDDRRDEADGAVTAVLLAGPGYRLGQHPKATATVRDDDERAVLVRPTALVVEEGGRSGYEVALATEPAGAVTVTASVPGGTDVSVSPPTVIFGPADWHAAKTLGVRAAEDADVGTDPPVVIAHAVSGADYAGEAADPVTVTIVENDAAALWIEDAAGREGDGELRLQVSLSLAVEETVTVDYGTSDGTAAAGGDYVRSAAALTFPPGETSTTVVVPLLDDAVHEDTEDFLVALANPHGAVLARREAVATIEDDDDLPVLSVGDARADEGAGHMVFAVVMEGTTDAAVTVDYAMFDVTATDAEDYAAVPGSLTLAPGDGTASIVVAVLDDMLEENDETFRVVLANPSRASLGDAEGTGTIVDDDATLALSVADARAAENDGEVAVEISLDAAPESPVSVEYGTAEVSALAGRDFAAAHGSVTFTPGERVATVAVELVDDAVHEPTETFLVTLANPGGATIVRSAATVAITDDDPVPQFFVGDAVGREDVGELVFDVGLEGESDRHATVNYTTADVLATAGTDYRTVAGTLTFAPGERSRSFVVPVLDDAVVEEDETFEVRLSDAAGATVGAAVGVGTIEDDDVLPPEVALPMADIVMPVGTTRTVGLPPHFVGDPTGYSAAAENDSVGLTVDGDELTVHGLAVGVAEVAVSAFNEAGEAVQTFMVTVVAPPLVSSELPDLALCVDGDPREFDLAAHFSGSSLVYAISSSAPRVASVRLDGTVLAVTPVAEGATTVSVTAANVLGQTMASFTVKVVADEVQLAAMEAALAGVARNMLASVGDALAARFNGTRRGTHDVVEDTAYQPRLHNSARAASPRWSPSDHDRLSTPAEWGTGPPDNGNRRNPSVPRLSLVITGTEMGFWVRGDRRRFRGDEAGSHEGTLQSVHFGLDSAIGDGLIGLSASRMTAEVDYRFRRAVEACGPLDGEGVLTTELDSVQPYASWPVGRGVVWGVVGAGRGRVADCRCDAATAEESDLDARMAMLGGRWPLGVGRGRVAWSLIEDVGLLRLRTGDRADALGGHDLLSSRIRIGVEARGTGGTLRPFVNAMARHDGGDGETGAGLELAGGVRYRHPVRRLAVTAEGRALAVHSIDSRREFGMALTVTVPPCRDLTGLSLHFESEFGADVGMSPMWRTASLGDAWPQGTGARGWTLNGRIGYGRRMPIGVATPFIEVNAGAGRSRAALGTRYGLGVGPERFDVVLAGGAEDRLGRIRPFIEVEAALSF